MTINLWSDYSLPAFPVCLSLGCPFGTLKPVWAPRATSFRCSRLYSQVIRSARVKIEHLKHFFSSGVLTTVNTLQSNLVLGTYLTVLVSLALRRNWESQSDPYHFGSLPFSFSKFQVEHLCPESLRHSKTNGGFPFPLQAAGTGMLN